MTEGNNNKQQSNSQIMLVLVTGANGFIGSSLVQELLLRGYHVRGTVRDSNNPEKTKTLRSFPLASTHLELVDLELSETSQEVYDTIVQNVNWIFHSAAMVDLVPRQDEDYQIQIAVQSMLSLLRAAAKTPSVTKFIVTGSVAAVAYGHGPNEQRGNVSYTENNWTNVETPTERSLTYSKTKTLSEKAAWDFMDEHLPNFTLSTILPTFVFGPVPSKDVDKIYMRIIARLMQGQGPGLLNLSCAAVDIRDVVEAHIRAATIPQAAGKRFILNHFDGYLPEIAAILRENFQPMGYTIKSWVIPTWMVWLLSFLDSELANIYFLISKEIVYDNSQSKEILGIQYINFNQTLMDSVHSMIEHGLIAKTPGYYPPFPQQGNIKRIEPEL